MAWSLAAHPRSRPLRTVVRLQQAGLGPSSAVWWGRWSDHSTSERRRPTIVRVHRLRVPWRPAEPDLEPRLGMMSNEAGQPFGSKRPDVTGAIELMQASLLQVGRVADVVQVGCGDQVGAIFAVEDRSYGAGALADSSDVLPSIAERR